MSVLEASSPDAGSASVDLAPDSFRKILNSTPLLLLVTAAVYFAAVKLGIAASIGPHGIAIAWPANAIVLFIFLSLPRRKWWIIYLTIISTEIAADVAYYPWWAAIGYGTVNATEAVLAAFLIRWFKPAGPPLESVRDFALFVLIGPVIAAGLAAFGGAAMYKLADPQVDYFHYWRIFWFGDALGLLVLAPALLVWFGENFKFRRTDFRAKAEALALALGLLVTAVLTFAAPPNAVLVYPLFPFLLWAALRFGIRGASAAMIALVATAICAAHFDTGPLQAVSNIESVVALQSPLGVVALSAYLLALSVEAWWRADAELAEAHAALAAQNKALDQIVARKTEQLTLTIARNELLLREIHHRVKNNLQLVSSILSLKARRNPALSETFDTVQRQISAIAATYDAIQQMEQFDSVDFCKVAAAVCSNLSEAFGNQIRLDHDVKGEAKLAPNVAVGLSLVLNELITNSVKQCARKDRVASVFVSCGQDDGTLALSITDDGPGFPADFDPAASTAFGMQMIRHVVAQASGRLHTSSQAGGATVTVHLPIDRSAPSHTS